MATRTTSNEQGERTYLTATYFSLFLGVLGVDRFYMGYTGLGILKLITIGGFGIWWLIDLIWIALGNAKTKNGVRLIRTESAMRLVYIGVGIFLLLQISGSIVGTISYTSSLRSADKNIKEFTDTIRGAVIEMNEGSDGDQNGTIKITLPKDQ